MKRRVTRALLASICDRYTNKKQNLVHRHSSLLQIATRTFQNFVWSCADATVHSTPGALPDSIASARTSASSIFSGGITSDAGRSNVIAPLEPVDRDNRHVRKRPDLERFEDRAVRWQSRHASNDTPF